MSNIENQNWWRKQISPGLSFIILIVFTLVVLVIGIFFVKEYVGAWTEINESKQQIDYYPDKPTGLGKMLIPD